MTVAAFLASIGTSITGLAIDDHTITVVGIICTVISTAIYAAVQAWVDASKEASSTTSSSTTTTVSACGKQSLDAMLVAKDGGQNA